MSDGSTSNQGLQELGCSNKCPLHYKNGVAPHNCLEGKMGTESKVVVDSLMELMDRLSLSLDPSEKDPSVNVDRPVLQGKQAQLSGHQAQ
jgi:hypothetical protein